MRRLVFCLWIIVYSTDVAALEDGLHFVDLSIDGKTAQPMDVLWKDGEPWLPSIFVSNLPGLQRKDNDLSLDTPAGSASLSATCETSLDSVSYISSSCLRDGLAISSDFVFSEYRLNVTLSWWTIPDSPSKKANLQAEYHPDSAVISSVTLESSLVGNGSDDLQKFVRGSLFGSHAGGTIEVEGDYYEEIGLQLQRYFWTKSADNSKYLIGSDLVSLNPLLPAARLTGGQIVLSNKRFLANNRNYSSADFSKNLGSSLRDFRGVAEPGAIVELLINNRSTATTRSMLDGTFEFLDVALPSRQLVNAVARVRSSVTGAVIETIDLSVANSTLLLREGEIIAAAGGGVNGDPVSSIETETEPSGYAQLRMGLSDRSTVEFGHQDIGFSPLSVLSLSSSLGRYAVGSGSYAKNGHGSHSYLAEVSGVGDNWYFQLSSRKAEAGFLSEISEAFEVNELIYRTALSRRISVGLDAREDNRSVSAARFLLPGISWSSNYGYGASLWAGREGDYRLDASVNSFENTQLRYTYESGDQNFSVDFYDDNVTYFGRFNSYRNFGSRFEVGSRWSSDANIYDRASIGIVLTDSSNVGGYFFWDKLLVPGLLSRFEIRDAPQIGATSNDLSFRWSLRADLGFDGIKPRLISSASSNKNLGAVRGFITVDGVEKALPGVTSATIVLNGAPRTALVNKGQFTISDVAPGYYRATLDASGMPLELVPSEKVVTLRVNASSTTRVTFSAEELFSLSGTLTDSDSHPAVGINVCAEKIGAIASSRCSTTDEFGYYVIDRLKRARYTIKSSDVILDEEMLLQDFILDANYTLATRVGTK